MAIKELKREWCPSQLAYVKEFLLHTEDELQHMPRCSVGSKATVSETDNEYVKTTDGWMLLCDCDEDGGTGAGGGGVQPDWNQNDPEAADYVKGRTHYEEVTYDSYRVNEASNPSIKNGAYVRANVSGTFGTNMVLIVVLDGQEYIDESQQEIVDGETYYFIGDKEYVNRPYYIKGKKTGYPQFYTNDDQSHSIAVYHTEKYVNTVTIDPKFLPDSVPYTEVKREAALPECSYTGKSAYANNQEWFVQGLSQGDACVVVCDGEEYRCTVGYNDILCTPTLGNASLGNLGDDTGEPFFINNTSAGQMSIIYFASEGEHTLGVYTEEEIVHTLNPKYLPAFVINAVVSPTDTTTGTVTADKTYAEIRAAVESGQNVVCHATGIVEGITSILHPEILMDGGVAFYSTSCGLLTVSISFGEGLFDAQFTQVTE